MKLITAIHEIRESSESLLALVQDDSGLSTTLKFTDSDKQFALVMEVVRVFLVHGAPYAEDAGDELIFLAAEKAAAAAGDAFDPMENEYLTLFGPPVSTNFPFYDDGTPMYENLDLSGEHFYGDTSEAYDYDAGSTATVSDDSNRDGDGLTRKFA